VVVSQVTPGRKNRLWLEVDGAHEAIAFDQEAPEVLWCGRREAATLVPRDADALSRVAARYVTMPAGHPEGYAACFEAFVADAYRAIQTGESIDGLPVFADGLRAARITEAVLASARAQAWVQVDDRASGPGAADGDAIVEVGG
jgi:predicted dehydrogenase